MQNMKYNCDAQGQPYLVISDPDESSSDEDIDDKSDNGFLQLQEANNICLAAYREVMTLAINAKAWKMGLPPLGSIEDMQQVFKTPPSPGLKVESSVERVILPLSPRFLITTMIDVDKWASTFSHIVHRGSVQDPTGVFGRLSAMHRGKESGNCIDMTIVNAEFHLPTPFVQKQKYRFVRFVRSVMEDTWAVVDLSTDYFQQHSLDSAASKVNCLRRPSGVIVKRLSTYENLSEVIWIENMEVKGCKFDDDEDNDDVQSGTMNSNLAFDAKQWVDILSPNHIRRCANPKISSISDQVMTQREKNEVSMETLIKID